MEVAFGSGTNRLVGHERVELSPLGIEDEVSERCNVKGCPFPAIHWLRDINEVIPVCSQHGEFFHEEAGYFDTSIRLSFLSQISPHSTLAANLQDELHPSVGFRFKFPAHHRQSVSAWARDRADRRLQEKMNERRALEIEDFKEKLSEARRSWFLPRFSGMCQCIRGWRVNKMIIPFDVWQSKTEKSRFTLPEILDQLVFIDWKEAKQIHANRVRTERNISRYKHYRRMHEVAKWSPFADMVAQLSIGESFFVPHTNPRVYARQMRNGLNSNKSSLCIPRSVISQKDGIVVSRVADFGHFYSGKIADGDSAK